MAFEKQTDKKKNLGGYGTVAKLFQFHPNASNTALTLPLFLFAPPTGRKKKTSRNGTHTHTHKKDMEEYLYGSWTGGRRKRKKSDEYATESEQSAHTQALVLIAPPISLYGCSLHISIQQSPSTKKRRKFLQMSLLSFSLPPSLFFWSKENSFFVFFLLMCFTKRWWWNSIFPYVMTEETCRLEFIICFAA